MNTSVLQNIYRNYLHVIMISNHLRSVYIFSVRKEYFLHFWLTSENSAAFSIYNVNHLWLDTLKMTMLDEGSQKGKENKNTGTDYDGWQLRPMPIGADRLYNKGHSAVMKASGVSKALMYIQWTSLSSRSVIGRHTQILRQYRSI